MPETYETISIAGWERVDWLEARRGFIGGSDAAAVVRLHPYKSAYELALDKMGALPIESESSEAAYWGTKHEETILKHVLTLPRFAGFESIDTKEEMYLSEIHPWASANLDGLLRAPSGALIGVEVKTASEYKREDWDELTNKAPINYVLQCLHYMAVRRDIERFVLAALVGGNKFFLIDVPRDDEAIAELMNHEEAFMKMIEEGRLPAPSGSDRDHDILAALSPEPEGEVDLEESVEELGLQYLRARDDETDAKARKKALGNLIFEALGDAKKGRAGRVLVNRIVSDVPAYMVEASHRDYITVKEAKQ